ncbi:MAG TPA: hypothetical protein VKA06_04725, partial [Spirochaetia bacterium]|nr:hypothetical protein [Spirochaetia bacterium]
MRREAVGLSGLAAFLLAWLLPTITVKPNRVAEGSSEWLWNLGDGIVPVVVPLLASFLLLIVLTTIPRLRRFPGVRLVASAAAIPLFIALLVL